MKIFKITDIVLIFVLLTIALSLNFYISKLINDEGSVALIEVNGELYKKIDLEEDKKVEIIIGNNINIVEIKEGKVLMSDSSCKDKYCVNHYPINKKNETIVCLPNKVVISIIVGEENDFDVISY